MSSKKKSNYDEIGYWSEVKLDIVRRYAAEYSKIMHAQKKPPLYHLYIDAFAGTGKHISKVTGDFVPGSPQNALIIRPPFKEYHFIDIDSAKVSELRKLSDQNQNVKVYEGNCNKILIDQIFPRAEWRKYRRALCLLDPYGLHLNWDILLKAGQMKSIDIFYNFSIMDANMNVLWRDPNAVDPQQIARMNACWGDESWKNVAYTRTKNLFGFEEKTDTASLVTAFQERLKKNAGFGYVPKPIPMRNSTGATVYYLFFASQKPVAEKIIKYIFDKYRNRGVI